MFQRLGRWAYRRHWIVIALWLAGLAVLGAAMAGAGTAYEESFAVPESESQDGFEVLEEHFGGFGAGVSGSIVFAAEQGVMDPEIVSVMSHVFDEISNLDGVESVLSPYDVQGERQISMQPGTEGSIAYATVDLGSEINQTESTRIGVDIHTILEESGADNVDGLAIEVGGRALAEFEPPESEAIGIAFAIVVLIFAMGSVLAMGATIGTALFGVGAAVVLVGLISHIVGIPDMATTVGVMIGLGVGIDYGLLIVTRYRDGLAEGQSNLEAIGVSLDTAGRSVVFASLTVVVSLLGMLLIGVSFVGGVGVSAAATVGIVMLATITLLPAILGLAGARITVTRWRGAIAAGLVALALLGFGIGMPILLACVPIAIVVVALGTVVRPLSRLLPARKQPRLETTIWYRWSRTIQHRPWRYAIGVSLVLLVLASPVLDLRFGFSDEGNYPEGSDTKNAYDLLVEGFGPGSNGPILIVGEINDPADIASIQAGAAAIGQTPGVAQVTPPIPNDASSPTAVLIQVIPTTSPQDEATEQLVGLLRQNVVPAMTAGTSTSLFVTGEVAMLIDFTDYLTGRTVVFFGAVLALSFVLLMMVFRSIVVPLKAVIMNTLSIAAAFGVTVAVFQWGWGSDLFGTGAGPIEPFIPMMMFAIVFGLSMDYEVFLLSRIREEYEISGDARDSVATGLAKTAAVITAAAAIMIVVFGSFVFEDSRTIKMVGLGLSIAILIDATLIRMLLVPATMQLLGRSNWWLPNWLDRLLPALNVEGTTHTASTEPATADRASSK